MSKTPSMSSLPNTCSAVGVSDSSLTSELGRLIAESCMSYYVARLKRPYDFRVLIDAYIYARRKDFVHSDFTTYYTSLLDALQGVFGIYALFRAVFGE